MRRMHHATAVGLAIALSMAAAGASAQIAPGTPAPVSAAASAPLEGTIAIADGQRGGEPAVQRTVIDDGRARIEEVRVRGQLQKVTVDPKGRLPGYEILVGDGSRDLSFGANTSRGAAGKRVWNVLAF